MTNKSLNEEQQRRVADAPILYRGMVRRAYDGKSKLAGIKAFCLQCTGYERLTVAKCTALGCPLWPYRPYQKSRAKVSESD